MKFHDEKGADISIIYKEGKIPHLANMMCFDINDDNRITGITVPDEPDGEGKYSGNIILMRKALLEKLITEARSKP